MRRINSEFKTLHVSEEGQKLSNRDYFGFVEMDDFSCYVLADSLDEEPSVNSARLVVESIIRDFVEKPSMSRWTLNRYVRKAHAELLAQRKGMHLKAAVVVVATDYRKIRYCSVGNSRFYWIRNTRVLEKSKDQSLTQNLLDQEQIPLDQAAAHEERNNLYSFLGERGTPKVRFSRKKRLEDGDIFLQLTRGVWEQCTEPEMLQIINDAQEPLDIPFQVEDLILKRQDVERIDNYTLAITFVNKIYQSPKKKWTLKSILMVVLPVLVVVAAATVALVIRHRSIRKKTEAMLGYMKSGEEYFLYSNFPKAADEYGEAKKLADSLGRKEEGEESDKNLKLAEQIVLGDEALESEEYDKAQELYLSARKMSVDAGNVGLSYIEGQLDRTEGYIEIFDLMIQGERKEEYDNLKGAIDLYKQAKRKAASLHFSKGKEEALNLQMAAEEKLEKEQMEAEEQLQEEINAQIANMAKEKEQKENDQQNAIDLENQGNELMAGKNFDSAITFYKAAQTIYGRLRMSDRVKEIDQKVAAAQAGISAMGSNSAQE